MTESRGLRPRYILDFIDSTPRSLRGWASYLGVSQHIVRTRAQEFGLEQAIKIIQAGTTWKWSPKDPRGQCKKGHTIEGGNILVVIDKHSGKEIHRCRQCYRKETPLQSGKKRALKCARGLHALSGDNVVLSTRPNGTQKRICRACRNRNARVKKANLKAGVVVEQLIHGAQTVEARIAAYSDSHQVSGCILWTGPLQNDAPWLNHKSFAPSSGKMVRSYLWERKTGISATTFAVHPSCGNLLCIALDHLVTPTRNVISKTRLEKRRASTRKSAQQRPKTLQIHAKQGNPKAFLVEGLIPMLGETPPDDPAVTIHLDVGAQLDVIPGTDPQWLALLLTVLRD